MSEASVRSQAVTVGTSPQALPGDPLPARRSLAIHNAGSVTLYVGGITVTTVNGLPVAAGASVTIDVGAAPIYGVAASGTLDVRILEIV